MKETGLSNDQKLACSNNPRPNIWNKVEKSSEIGQGKKAKISLQGFTLILTEVVKEKLIIFWYKNPISAFFPVVALTKY